MVSFVNGISAKSALFQLRSQNEPQADKQRYGNVLTNTLGRGASRGADAFFSISNSLKSESTIFNALNEGLGRARGAVAAAQVGANRVDGVLDKIDGIVGAVEAGAPGGAFKGSLDRLQQATALAVRSGAFAGTNLLEEGANLSVTLGFNGGGNADFRQLNFTAVGLSPTDAAKAASTTVTETVTETVEVDVTRQDKLNERTEKLTERLERFDAREERLNSKLTKLDANQAKQEARLEKLERQEVRREQKLVDVGARPTDANDQRTLDLAKRISDFADTLEARGSTRLAEFVDAVAERTAERAGLTVSLDELDRLETRLEKTQNKITKTNDKLTRIQERTETLNQRIETVAERRETVSDKLAATEERLSTLSEERLNQVVGTRTETVEREVTREVESPTAGSFFDIVGAVGERLQAGDTEGARALINEARARVNRVEEQLDQISGSLDRRGGFFGALTDRIDSSIKTRVDEGLSDEDAAARAAAIISDIAKNGRLFGGERSRPGILGLFAEKSEPAAEPKEE